MSTHITDTRHFSYYYIIIHYLIVNSFYFIN